MDTLTHGLAGALLAQTGLQQRYGRIATGALVIGAELPDVDFLFDLAGPVTAFQNHRGITHAFIGGAGLALAGAAVLYGMLRYRAYWRLVLLVYLGVVLHIWMDYLTSYGTQLFLPFDAGRYTADAVFIIDYVYTGIIATTLLVIRMIRRQRHTRYRAVGLVWLLIGAGFWFGTSRFVPDSLMVLAWRRWGLYVAFFSALIVSVAWIGGRWDADRSRLVGRCGVAALAAYIGLCMAAHTLAKQRFAAMLAQHMGAVQQIAAIPLPGGLLGWRGIATTPSAYLVSRITLFPPAASPVQTIPKGLEQGMVRTTGDYRLVQVFRKFARFPVVEYRRQGGEQIVRYFDLRFSGYGGKSWLDLEVHFDTAGRLRGITFLNRLFLPQHADF